jgi:hypothetical protein
MMPKKILIVFYQQLEHKWSMEECIKFYSRNDINGLVGSRSSEVKGAWRRLEKGTCPLCMEYKDVKHILLTCPETKKCIIQFVKSGYIQMRN